MPKTRQGTTNNARKYSESTVLFHIDYNLSAIFSFSAIRFFSELFHVWCCVGRFHLSSRTHKDTIVEAKSLSRIDLIWCGRCLFHVPVCIDRLYVFELRILNLISVSMCVAHLLIFNNPFRKLQCDVFAWCPS